MDISMKALASAAGAASLSLVIAVAPVPASACDVSSPTDISCPGANSNPANPLYSVGHPTLAPPAPAFDPGYPANPPYGYGGAGALDGGGILSSLFGAEPAAPAPYAPEDAAPGEAPLVHHRHHRRHKHVE